MAVDNDEIRELERRQNELRDELNKKSSEIERIRKNITEENREQLRKFREETQLQIKQHEEATLEEYTKLLDRNTSQAMEEIQREFEKSRQEYEEIQLQLRKAYALEQKKTTEIFEKQKEFEKAYFKRLEFAKETAEKTLEEVLEIFNKATLKNPIEWFLKGHMSLYRSHIQNMKQWINQGFYETAIGVGNNILLSLKIDILEVEERFYKWLNYYTILFEMLETERDFIFNKFKIVSNEYKFFIKAERVIDNIMSDEVTDYWSDGKSLDIKNTFIKFSEEVSCFLIDGKVMYDETTIREFMIENPEKSSEFKEMWLYTQGVKAISRVSEVKKVAQVVVERISCFEERYKIFRCLRKAFEKKCYIFQDEKWVFQRNEPLYLHFTDDFCAFKINIIIVPVHRKADNKWINVVKCFVDSKMNSERKDDITSIVAEVLSKFGIALNCTETIKSNQSDEERIKLAGVDMNLFINGRLN